MISLCIFSYLTLLCYVLIFAFVAIQMHKFECFICSFFVYYRCDEVVSLLLSFVWSTCGDRTSFFVFIAHFFFLLRVCLFFVCLFVCFCFFGCCCCCFIVFVVCDRVRFYQRVDVLLFFCGNA